MKIAVFADIHGNYKALENVLADIEGCGADASVVLGDIIFKGGEPQKCFDAIKELKPLIWIRGNTDDWFNEIDEDFVPSNEAEKKVFAEFQRISAMITPETGMYLSMLNGKQEIEISGKKLLCVHGSDRSINEQVGIMTSTEDIHDLFLRLDAGIMLCAHTHYPYSASYNGKLIINVGSVGMPADEPRPCWCLLKFEDEAVSYEFRRVNPQ